MDGSRRGRRSSPRRGLLAFPILERLLFTIINWPRRLSSNRRNQAATRMQQCLTAVQQAAERLAPGSGARDLAAATVKAAAAPTGQPAVAGPLEVFAAAGTVWVSAEGQGTGVTWLEAPMVCCVHTRLQGCAALFGCRRTPPSDWSETRRRTRRKWRLPSSAPGVVAGGG